jgi:hypothetical protein
VVAYFARPRPGGAQPEPVFGGGEHPRRVPGGPPAFREWGTRLARVPDGASWRWVPGPDADPPVTTGLEPLIRSGQLFWIEPFDPGVQLRSDPEGCPWLADGRSDRAAPNS